MRWSLSALPFGLAAATATKSAWQRLDEWPLPHTCRTRLATAFRASDATPRVVTYLSRGLQWHQCVHRRLSFSLSEGDLSL